MNQTQKLIQMVLDLAVENNDLINIDKNILEAFMPTAAQEESMRKLCEMMGYNMKYATSYRKIRGRSEYRCFDIRYQCTPSRIMKLGRVSAELMLQPSEDS